MKEWSDNARTWMSLLGEYTPAKDGKHVQGVGYDYEGDGGVYRRYLDAESLRKLAAACLEVAESLEGGGE